MLTTQVLQDTHMVMYPKGDEYLTVKEAATLLKVSMSTMRRLITGDKPAIPIARIGRLIRINKADLLNYLASQTIHKN